MTVYNDMAHDAGYGYGTYENRQMAEMLEYQEMQASYEQQRQEQAEYDQYCEQQYNEYIYWLELKACRRMWE